MRKDPTEFRERFAKWKAGEKVYESGLPKYGDGTTNMIPEDLQGLSDPQFQPQIDAAKVQMTPFVVDDTAYRAQKYHPGTTREQVQELYNNTPYIGSYNKGMLARPSVGAYFSDRDDYPFVRIGQNKPYSVKQMIAHESGHVLDRKLFGGRTKEEMDVVRAAYGNIPGMTDDEMFQFNREVRQAISENNRNAIKEKLDAVLKEIKGKDINWTIKNGKFGHADEAYKANIDPEAVRKALLEVAQNKYTFDKGNGIMLAKNGKSAGLPAYGGGKSKYDNIIKFIKQYEGFKDTTYLDGNGIPTIGYGFTDSSLVKKGRITREEADRQLIKEIQQREATLSKLKNWNNLGEDAKAALFSYYYNYPAGFGNNTKFMKYWNAEDFDNAIREVDAGMNDKKNPGLRTRRLQEQQLLRRDPFLKTPRRKQVGAIESMMETAPRFVPPVVKMQIPVQTDYSIQTMTDNSIPAMINSRNSGDSPIYGGNDYSFRMPSLKEYVERNLMRPQW